MSYLIKPRILCVDDEPNLLFGLKRQLGKYFDVTTALGGIEGLQVFQQSGPFAVVVSDLKMPQMDGVTFLGKIRQAQPDTVRVLLTGQADLNSAIAAVNEGQIFRFLMKPCSTEDLLQSLKAAQNQYNLITAEKVLLEQTLQGSIKTLSDILSLANPDLFSMVNRLKPLLNRFVSALKIHEKWHIEVATMLCHIGIITLPEETLQKLKQQLTLLPAEKDMLTQIPKIGEKLLAHIPRLEPVREILLYQNKHYDGSGLPENNIKEQEIPLGARILKILLDYDKLQSKGYESVLIFETMLARSGWYDTTLLKTFASLFEKTEKIDNVLDITASAMETGMILAEDLYSMESILLVRKGMIVTPALLARILNSEIQTGIKEPIKVIVPQYFEWLT